MYDDLEVQGRGMIWHIEKFYAFQAANCLSSKAGEQVLSADSLSCQGPGLAHSSVCGVAVRFGKGKIWSGRRLEARGFYTNGRRWINANATP